MRERYGVAFGSWHSVAYILHLFLSHHIDGLVQERCNFIANALELRLSIDGLLQERRNSRVLAMELRLSCTKPSICNIVL